MSRRPRTPRATTCHGARLSGIQLLIESPSRRALIPDLGLDASIAGISVVSPTGSLVGHFPWASITAFDAGGESTGADGLSRQLLEMGADGRSHRFLVPAPDLAAFLAEVGTIDPRARLEAPDLLRRAGTSATGRPRARSVLALVGGTGHRPRHAAKPRVRVAAVVAGVCALALAATGATVASLGSGGASAANVPAANGFGVSIMPRMAKAFGSSGHPISLPAATAQPKPAPPSLAGAPPLNAHEIFGFAPYWTLGNSSGFDLKHLTTLAYFSIDVNGDGTVDQSSSGWSGYQSQDLVDLITRAHAAGDRVVLTATCFGQSALDQLASDPSGAARLAPALAQLVGNKNLDGINLDFEGQGSKDRSGLDRVVSTVSAAMRQANPHWQVTMDTYASAAGDTAGFYDIPGLAPSLDAFFVMAYDMNSFSTPSPTSPLTGPGFSDLDAVQQYTAVVPPSKVILGVPYYGYDWPTAGPGLGDPATGPASPITYSGFAAAGHPVYWDPITQTPWTSYQVGTQWHQAWMDNPTSLTLKARLANTYHIGGLGIWALGMDGNVQAMLAALLGNGPVVKDLPAGPGATPPATVPPATVPPATVPPATVPPGTVPPTSTTTTSSTTTSTTLAGP